MQALTHSKFDQSWTNTLQAGIASLEPRYISRLSSSNNWLPGEDKVFNAFNLPINQVKYVLFGESPYPRAESANGYAFFDAAVDKLWSPSGLATAVNRATSLRNLIKMMLIANNSLSEKDTSQAAIAKVQKDTLVQTLPELFANFMQHGILLLNSTLVLTEDNPKYDVKQWLPFMDQVLAHLAKLDNNITLILFGNLAKTILGLPSAKLFRHFKAEHPYNVSFITNQSVLNFFKPFDLLHTLHKSVIK